MKSILIIMIFLLPALCWAVEIDQFDETRDVLSEKYVSGNFLIYDCVDQHWVCAMKDNQQICEARRDKEIRLGKHFLSCVSAEVFENYKTCRVKQQSLVKLGIKPRSCLHPSERKRLIGFQ